MITFADDKATARIAARVLRQRHQRHARRVERRRLCRPARAGSLRHRILAARRGEAPAHAEAESLAGRVALVTGGAGGIGRAIAARLLGEGACVVLADIDERRARRGRRRRSASASARMSSAASIVDVTDESGVDAALRRDGARLRRRSTSSSPMPASPPPRRSRTPRSTLWNRNMDDPGDGLFPRLARGLPPDEATEARRLASSSSPRRTALAASPDASAYCTAKAAEIHLARCMALEGAPRRHPRQRRQPRRGAARLEDLAGRMARAARRRLQDEPRRARGALPPALAAEALASFPRTSPRRSISSPPTCRRRSTGNILNVDAGNAVSFTR